MLFCSEVIHLSSMSVLVLLYEREDEPQDD